VKVVILPNRDYVEGGPVNNHTHTLFFQHGSSTQLRQQAAERALAEKCESRPRQTPRGVPVEDDPVPF
jgi:hypothetical protein